MSRAKKVGFSGFRKHISFDRDSDEDIVKEEYGESEKEDQQLIKQTKNR